MRLSSAIVGCLAPLLFAATAAADLVSSAVITGPDPSCEDSMTGTDSATASVDACSFYDGMAATVDASAAYGSLAVDVDFFDGGTPGASARASAGFSDWLTLSGLSGEGIFRVSYRVQASAYNRGMSPPWVRTQFNGVMIYPGDVASGFPPAEYPFLPDPVDVVVTEDIAFSFGDPFLFAAHLTAQPAPTQASMWTLASAELIDAEIWQGGTRLEGLTYNANSRHDYGIDGATLVPEPMSLILLATVAACILPLMRRRSRKQA